MQRLSRNLISLLVGVILLSIPAVLQGQNPRALQGPRRGANPPGVQKWEPPAEIPLTDTTPGQIRFNEHNASANANAAEISLPAGQRATPISKNAASNNPAERSAAPDPWSTLGALAIVIALIVVTAKIWKKHGPLVGHAIPPEAVEVLGRRMIDQRQSIHLVRLGSRILVLGSSPAGLRTLAEITDPVEADLLAGLCQKRPGENGTVESFRALFKKQATQLPSASSLTGTVTNSHSREQTARELEQRLRAAGESLRHSHPERTQR